MAEPGDTSTLVMQGGEAPARNQGGASGFRGAGQTPDMER